MNGKDGDEKTKLCRIELCGDACEIGLLCKCGVNCYDIMTFLSVMVSSSALEFS